MTSTLRQPPATSGCPHGRRGHALVVTVIVLSLASALSVGLVRGLLDDYQQLNRQLLRVQAELLAEAILQEAALQLQRDPEYAGELRTVQVPGAEFGPAEVQIEVAPEGLRAVVQLPTDAPRQDQVRMELRRPRGTP